MKTIHLVASLLLILIVALPAAAQYQTPMEVSAAPEAYRGGSTLESYLKSQTALTRVLSARLPRGFNQRPIVGALSADEQAVLAEPQLGVSGVAPVRVGLVKSLLKTASANGFPHGQAFRSRNRVGGGVFETTADGGFVWSATVSSPGAYGMRLHFNNFSIPDNSDFYFMSLDGQVRGPYQRQGPNGDGDFWTNTIFAESGVMVLRHFGAFTDRDLRSVSFRVSELGHIGRGFPTPLEQNWAQDKCGNSSCVIDANCGNLGPATAAAHAVAKMEWVQGPYIYTCTGGLLTDTNPSSQRLLFLSANHCLNKSNSNLETFFHFVTAACNGNCPGNTAPNTTGATKLVTGSAGDFTLFELNSGNPPAGAVFLGWNNSPIAFTNGARFYRVSNPNFGPQVYSHHRVDTAAPTCSGWARGQRIYSRDIEGATDGGSSGSPVVNSAGEVVGQLSGCCGLNCGNVCNSTSNATVDGALAYYWNSVAPILNPNGGGSGCTSNAQCDDGLFCNGAESCGSGSCRPGTNPCPGLGCNENTNQCITCAPLGASCNLDGDCCSNKCKGPAGGKTCR